MPKHTPEKREANRKAKAKKARAKKAKLAFKGKPLVVKKKTKRT